MEVQMMHQNKINKTKAHTFFPVWIRQRELRRLPLGHSDAFYKSLYSSISPCHSWDEEGFTYGQGIFSLGFSPDGTVLVAGFGNKFGLFDPLSRRLIRTVRDLNSHIFTHVKFLNSCIFAMGSVDGTVSLWDSRNLRERYETLKHSNMIENVEYSQKHGLLITSGHAESIYMWDTKNWNLIWKSNTFMPHLFVRLRLSPDETKMIISTTYCYLLIVHDLDLITLAQDLDEFFSGTLDFESLLPANTTPGCHSSRFVFPNRRRNRMEVVADFPNAGGFNVLALEIHPQGWSVLSRISNDASRSEWTCVHDIQEKPSKCGAASRRVRERRSGSPADTARNPPTDTLKQAGFGSNPSSSWDQDPSLPSPNSSVAQFNRTDHGRCPRLTHYIEEPYSGKWNIDSLGVSADGRLLCSPLEHGFRLLAFSPECSEQSASWCGTYPRRLHELSTHVSDSGSILCTKFSPHHCLFVCGSLDGKLAWYQPVV